MLGRQPHGQRLARWDPRARPVPAACRSSLPAQWENDAQHHAGCWEKLLRAQAEG